MKKSRPLNKSEAQTLKFIRDFYIRNGYMPTYQEIAEAHGYSARSWAHAIVKRLEEVGYLKRIVGKSRAIILDEDRTKAVQSKT